MKKTKNKKNPNLHNLYSEDGFAAVKAPLPGSMLFPLSNFPLFQRHELLLLRRKEEKQCLGALGSCYLQQMHALSQLQGAHVALHVGRIGLEDTCRAQVCLLILPLASMFPESTDYYS